jgi:hypothetical protein
VDNGIEKRLRAVETTCGACSPLQAERWNVLHATNKRLETRMEHLESCVRELKTTIKVNNVKVGMIFFVVQIVVSGLLLALLAQVLER